MKRLSLFASAPLLTLALLIACAAACDKTPPGDAEPTPSESPASGDAALSPTEGTSPTEAADPMALAELTPDPAASAAAVAIRDLAELGVVIDVFPPSAAAPTGEEQRVAHAGRRFGASEDSPTAHPVRHDLEVEEVFRPDEACAGTILSVCEERVIWWDRASARPTQHLARAEGTFARSPSGRTMALSTPGGVVVFATEAPQQGHWIALPVDATVTGLALTDEMLLVADKEHLTRFDWQQGRQAWQVPLGGDPSGLRLTPDARHVVVTDAALLLFEVEHGGKRAEWPIDLLGDFDLSGDSKWAVVQHQGSAHVASLLDGQIKASIPVAAAAHFFLPASADPWQLLIQEEEGACLYTAPTGERRWCAPGTRVLGVLTSGDSPVIAVHLYERLVRLSAKDGSISHAITYDGDLEWLTSVGTDVAITTDSSPGTWLWWDLAGATPIDFINGGDPLLEPAPRTPTPAPFPVATFARDRSHFASAHPDLLIGDVLTHDDGRVQLAVAGHTLLWLDALPPATDALCTDEAELEHAVVFRDGEHRVAALELAEDSAALVYFNTERDCLVRTPLFAHSPAEKLLLDQEIAIERGDDAWTFPPQLPKRFRVRWQPNAGVEQLVIGELGFAFLDAADNTRFEPAEQLSVSDGLEAWAERDDIWDPTVPRPKFSLQIHQSSDRRTLRVEAMATTHHDYEHRSGTTSKSQIYLVRLSDQGQDLIVRTLGEEESTDIQSWHGGESSTEMSASVHKWLLGPSDTAVVFYEESSDTTTSQDCSVHNDDEEADEDDPCCRTTHSESHARAGWKLVTPNGEAPLRESLATQEESTEPPGCP